uniref:Zinc finger CCCH-type containing 3 n=1 Tax=Latimeria chalumnae TaxID=7897 RepID=H2ZSK5_LATCH
ASDFFFLSLYLLSGLINNHKSLHGNAPASSQPHLAQWQHPRPTATARHGNFALSAGHSSPPQRPYLPQHGTTWKQKYSLVNRHPKDQSARAASAVTTSAPGTRGDKLPIAKPSVAGTKLGLSSLGNSSSEGVSGPPPSASKQERRKGGPAPSSKRPAWLPKGTAAGNASPSQLQAESSRSSMELMSAISGGISNAPHTLQPGKRVRDCKATGSASTLSLKPAGVPRPEATVASSAKSRYTWTKTVSGPTVLQPHGGQSAVEAVATQVARASPGLASSVSSPRVPPSTLPRKQTPGLLASNRSAKGLKAKYTWVASSTVRTARAGMRTAPSKTPECARKLASGLPKNVATKSAAEPTAGAKPKRTGASLKPESPGSKYRWKASSVAQSSSSLSSPSSSSAPKSVYKWKSEEQKKGRAFPRTGAMPVKTAFGIACRTARPVAVGVSSSGYKVKSRMKIIRKKSSLSLAVERKNSPAPLTVRNRFSVRRRSLGRVKSPVMLKKTPSKGLVQVSKHKLRRLSTSTQHGGVRQ